MADFQSYLLKIFCNQSAFVVSQDYARKGKRRTFSKSTLKNPLKLLPLKICTKTKLLQIHQN